MITDYIQTFACYFIEQVTHTKNVRESKKDSLAFILHSDFYRYIYYLSLYFTLYKTSNILNRNTLITIYNIIMYSNCATAKRNP